MWSQNQLSPSHVTRHRTFVSTVTLESYEPDMDAAFIRELENDFAGMLLGNSSADGRRSASQSGAGRTNSEAPEARRRSSRPSDDRSPLSQFDGQHSKRIASAARSEIAARKARKKDRKTICGRCGREKLEGTRLRTCSRCK